MAIKIITCPWCGKEARITYEENRLYQMKCYSCRNTMLHEDRSFDKAVEFFGHHAGLAQAEKDGRLVVQKAIPGKQIWIIERDECGEPCEISGYMFLAFAGHAVIVTPYINSLEDLDSILDYHIEETAENYDTDLAVFPVEDCYMTREEAEGALAGGDG